MNETQKQKIVRFLSDEVMCAAVYGVLLGTFLKGQPKHDVQTLAAERIAINLLQDGWKELRKVMPTDAGVSKIQTQPGL